MLEPDPQAVLELANWRRAVAELYAAVRAEPDPETAHALWRARRDVLFRTHPQSPLLPDDPLRETGLPYWPYDAGLRFTATLAPAEPQTLHVPTATDGVIELRRAGRLAIPDLDLVLDAWWLAQYAGGLFDPVKDGTATRGSYGGGRYLLDTVKGADLGTSDGRIILDFNFLYHPSCRYNPRWECPLAQPGNTTSTALQVGERMSHSLGG